MIARGASGFQFQQLVEMGVVVCDIEAVNLGARKDEEIGKGNGHT